MELEAVWEALRDLGRGAWRQPPLHQRALRDLQPTLFDDLPDWRFLHLGHVVGRWLWPADLRVSFRVEWGGEIESAWFLQAGFVRAEVVNVVGCFIGEPVAVVPGVALWKVVPEVSLEESTDSHSPAEQADEELPSADDLDTYFDTDEVDGVSEEEEVWSPDILLPFPDEGGTVEVWRMRTLVAASSTLRGVCVSASEERLRDACRSLGLTVRE